MKIQDKLLQYANSGDSDESTSDIMRKAALKIDYLEELVRAVDMSELDISTQQVRGESWKTARERALKAGNNE